MKFLSFKRKVVFWNYVNFHDLKIFIFISFFTKKEKEIRLERRKEEKKKRKRQGHKSENC